MTDAIPQTPLRIGLTGGIASGKSVVAKLFAELGVPVVDTDVIAKEVVLPGRPALDEIRKRFGEDMIDSHGHLDRAAMRRLIFADGEARRELEGIMHPRIGVETRRQANAAGGEYQLIVVPLLVGSELVRFVDRVLVVDCDEETQIRRLQQRDAESIDQAQRILAAQADRQARLALADDIIANDGSLQELRNLVTQLHRKYRRLAAQPCPREPLPEIP